MTAARALLAAATAQLAAAGVAAPRADAEQLLAYCLRVPRTRLAGAGRVERPTADCFAALVARRAAREPLQHLTGSVGFRYIDVAVGPGVFVPRPESELLVDAILPVLSEADAPVVVDLCSGSGALALAVALEVPAASVYAVERSPSALPWLRRNCAGTQVEVVAADIADPLLLDPLSGRVDAVLANPPYVPDGQPVAPEVRHDPDEGLFAGADGLAVIPQVIGTAGRLLRPGGVLAVEHDETQGAAVPALLRAGGWWRDVADHDDLTGRPRFATAVRTAAG
jgi:release factor glutamine methyltransferase